jgi:HK97 family phage major capsid protein
MSMKIMELKQQAAFATNKADAIISAAERAGRELTEAESQDVSMCMAAATSHQRDIKQRESRTSLASLVPNARNRVIMEGGRQFSVPRAPQLSHEYADAFYAYVGSNGAQLDAALYEGSEGLGGYAVPSMVDGNIVPLAPNEMSVRQLASVIPTAMDIRIPQKGSFGVAAVKAESTTSVPTVFAETDPTLTQITLSAYMAGICETVSWELAQDVPSFQAFCVDDMILAQQMFEENWYVDGTGVNQPQGLLGNVGAGVTGEVADANGNLLSLAAIMDVIGTLNSVYHPGAAFLMQRATGVALRKAQLQANLFEPAFTRVDGQDFLFGYPVSYSASMPSVAPGATPVLFGNFKMGYVIGDRGGSGINVKILDQPKALQGQLMLLAYRRTDGRVRRSEAIQGLTLHA